MNKDDLKKYGIVIKINKRSWVVLHHAINVASGNIGKEYNARNRARKEALEAAVKIFVLARINGNEPSVNAHAIFGQLTPQMRTLWAQSVWAEVKKDSFLAKFLKPGAVIPVKDPKDIQIIRIDPTC